MTNILTCIEKYSISLATNYVPYTNVIGLARSILALGTMLTLLLNSTDHLFSRTEKGVFFNPLLNIDIFSVNKFNFFLLIGNENIYIMKYIAISILLLVVSGYFIKITAILHWWICCSFMLSSSILDGGDQIASILSLLILPICLTDNRKNH